MRRVYSSLALSEDQRERDSTGIVAGIIAVILIILLVVLVVGILIFRWRKRYNIGGSNTQYLHTKHFNQVCCET